MYDSKTKIDIATSNLASYQKGEEHLHQIQHLTNKLNEEMAKLSMENAQLEDALRRKQQGEGGSSRKNSGTDATTTTTDKRKNKMRIVFDDDYGDDALPTNQEGGIGMRILQTSNHHSNNRRDTTSDERKKGKMRIVLDDDEYFDTDDQDALDEKHAANVVATTDSAPNIVATADAAVNMRARQIQQER